MGLAVYGFMASVADVYIHDFCSGNIHYPLGLLLPLGCPMANPVLRP